MKSQKPIGRKPSTSAAVAVVLFGVDETGKPKAATFGEKLVSLATTAAQQMGLQIAPIANPALAEIASQLPSGRIYSNGRGLVPFVRRDLYDKLIVAAGPSVGTGQSPTSPEGASDPSGNSSDSKGGAGRRPLDWDEIGPGDLVLDQEGLTDGWYAVIVVARKGDILTLRYRDFPRSPRFSENRLNVALLCPNGGKTPDDKGTTSGTRTQPSAKGTHKGAGPEKAASVFPQTWDQIEVDHLVLAMDDGPWRSWWEAIPVEIKDDVVTLRWRDYPSLPNVARRRFDLALLYPKAK
jgi:hypothetical protein